RYLNEEYISWLKVFRNLNDEGYLSKEIFIDNRAQLEEKIEAGRYFCLLYQGIDIESSLKVLKEKNQIICILLWKVQEMKMEMILSYQ
ncbi:MAG: hypothetical protein ACRC7V_04605, partial [Lachnospiraceae bacterium]